MTLAADHTDTHAAAARLAGQALDAVAWLGEPKISSQYAERAQIAALTSIALSLSASADHLDTRAAAARLAGQALDAVTWLGEPKISSQYAERAQIAALTSIALSLSAPADGGGGRL